MYKWKPEDDIVALYLHKFEGRRIGPSIDEIGEMLPMGASALKMRISNFVAVDAADGQWLPRVRRKGLPGLVGYSKQSAQVYRKYGHLPEAELRGLVFDYLAAVGGLGPQPVDRA